MVQFEQNDMARSEENEMVKRICHPPSNPIISETTLKRRETDRTYKILKAIAMATVAVIFLLSLHCFFMSFQVPAGEKQQEMRCSAYVLFATGILALGWTHEMEEIQRQNLQQGTEAGSPLVNVEN